MDSGYLNACQLRQERNFSIIAVPAGSSAGWLPVAGGGTQGGLHDGKEGFPGVGVGGYHHGDRPGEDAEEDLQERGAVAVRAAALAPVAGLAGGRAVPAQAVGVHLLPLAGG